MRRRLDPRIVAQRLNAQWRLRERAEVARSVRLVGRPVVKNKGTLIIRDRAVLLSTVAAIELEINDGGTLDIGERSFLNYGVSLSASSRVEIGADCHIGQHCMVMDNDFHNVDPERRLDKPPSRPVVLGANVWLAARVLVLPGVTIGDHSVIGAGSVVTSDVPSRTIAAGVPARVLRSI